jgi:hypothetical protein
MPIVDVDAAAGTSASKHDLAQQLAAAVYAGSRRPLIRIATLAFGRVSLGYPADAQT